MVYIRRGITSKRFMSYSFGVPGELIKSAGRSLSSYGVHPKLRYKTDTTAHDDRPHERDAFSERNRARIVNTLLARFLTQLETYSFPSLISNNTNRPD